MDIGHVANKYDLSHVKWWNWIKYMKLVEEKQKQKKKLFLWRKN